VDGSVWSFTVYYKSDLRGFSCSNCSSQGDSLVQNGDDLKIAFWSKSGVSW
jgi:hypothetical protein